MGVVADFGAWRGVMEYDAAWIRQHAEELAASDDWFDRYLVAETLGVQRSLLLDLAADEDWRVVAAARANPWGPSTLEVMAWHGWSRWRVGSSLGWPFTAETKLDTLKEHLGHSSPRVRADVARHPKATQAMLDVLRRDSVSEVRAAAAERVRGGTVHRALAGDVPVVAQALAGNEHVGVTVLRSLAFHADPWVRLAAVRNANLPEDALQVAAAMDTDEGVRVAAALALEGRPAGAPVERPEPVDPIPVFNAQEIEAVAREFEDRRPRRDAIAMHAVLWLERSFRRTATPMSHNQKGFDVLSVNGEGTAKLIEVKGVGAEAGELTVSRSQLEVAAQHPEEFILAVVRTDDERAQQVVYVQRPYPAELPASVAAVKLDVAELMRQGEVVYQRSGYRHEAPEAVPGMLF